MDTAAEISQSVIEIGNLIRSKGAKIDDLDTLLKSISARMLDLEQKILTRPNAGNAGAGDGSINIGSLIAKDARMEALRTGNAWMNIELKQGMRMLFKSILGNAGSTGVSPSFEFPGIPQLVPGGPRGFAGRRLELLNSLPILPAGGSESAVPFLENYSDEAGIQQHEGGAKSESTFNFENKILRHTTVATYFNISKQLIGDSEFLVAFLNSIVLYFVSRKLENLIVSGNGTTDGISGLLTQGTQFVPLSDEAVDRIGESLASLTSLGYHPDLIVLNPADYFGIIAARDANGRFIGPGWGAPTPNSLWGVRTIPTAALTKGTSVVLDSTQVAILDREQANVQMGYTGNQFTQNEATILAELRASLAVFDPHAVNVIGLPADSTV